VVSIPCFKFGPTEPQPKLEQQGASEIFWRDENRQNQGEKSGEEKKKIQARPLAQCGGDGARRRAASEGGGGGAEGRQAGAP
jgi:hypothetical protein